MNGRGAGKEWMQLLLVALLCGGAAFGIQYWIRKINLTIPQAGIDKISIDAEIKFASRVKSLLQEDVAVVKSSGIQSAIDTIANRITSAADSLPYPAEVMVVDGNVVNAVTFPGGLIVVYVPLLRLTGSPEQLAAVLAHELAHVINRDPARRMMRQFGTTTVLSIMGGGNNAYLQNVIKNLIDCSYTREQEKQADSLGLVILARAGINPSSFAEFMTSLENESRSKSDEYLRYFNTHPDVDSRIQRANSASLEFAGESKTFNIDWPQIKRELPSIFRK